VSSFEPPPRYVQPQIVPSTVVMEMQLDSLVAEYPLSRDPWVDSKAQAMLGMWSSETSVPRM
jgi:hypothetical protein